MATNILLMKNIIIFSINILFLSFIIIRYLLHVML